MAWPDDEGRPLLLARFKQQARKTFPESRESGCEGLSRRDARREAGR
jgi:hypothetical protein